MFGAETKFSILKAAGEGGPQAADSGRDSQSGRIDGFVFFWQRKVIVNYY